MKILFKNIKSLVQVRDKSVAWVAGNDMKDLPAIDDAYLSVDNGLITGFGKMTECPSAENYQVIDATDKMILPSWCDSHTHIVYAGNREGEFIDRINGLSYEEIASRGGGILNSAITLQNTSEEDLYQQSKVRLEEVIGLGTGAVEIKSGYGLTVDAELKMLRVIKRLKKEYNIPIRATFLAAHAIPQEYKEKKSEFLQLMIDQVMPVIAKEGLAEYVDVFCEKGYFSVNDTVLIMEAGKKYNLIPKIHVNQFNAIGGVKAAVDHGALSVDHLEVMRDEDIDALVGSKTMPVALPTCSYFLGIPYTPARAIIEKGMPLALATDYNPGSTPSGNMKFVVSTACIKMKITPAEAINAATINGAYALGLSDELGSITVGKRANLIMTKAINSIGMLPYAFGSDLIDQIFVNGQKWDR